MNKKEKDIKINTHLNHYLLLQGAQVTEYM